MRTSARPFAALALPLAASLALSACGEDAATETASAEGEATVSFTWDRNVAAEDADPEFEETTVEVPKDPETVAREVLDDITGKLV